MGQLRPVLVGFSVRKKKKGHCMNHSVLQESAHPVYQFDSRFRQFATNWMAKLSKNFIGQQLDRLDRLVLSNFQNIDVLFKVYKISMVEMAIKRERRLKYKHISNNLIMKREQGLKHKHVITLIIKYRIICK